MKRLAAIVLFLAIPRSGNADGRLRLLDGETLAFPVQTLQGLRQQALDQDEGPPTPPRDRASKSSKRSPEENPDVPSLGSVLGFMISGGVILVYGLVFTVYGLALRLPCTFSPGSCSTLGSLGAVGIGYSIAGGVMAAVGGVLLYFGNDKRIRRNEMREAAQVNFSFDPMSRSAWVTYAKRF